MYEKLKELILKFGQGSDDMWAFIEKWLPLEEAYIREYDIEHICDAVLDFHK